MDYATPRRRADARRRRSASTARRSTPIPRSDRPARPRERFDELVRRRVRREPVAYILGRAHFRELDLLVDHRVLIPRPETELLVELARGWQRVLDVGTGSGAIALAIAQERAGVTVTGIDSSPGAVDVARANAQQLGLEAEFMIADLVVGGPYDLVVSNPPYVRDSDWPGLAPEITLYEPEDALLGGPDGLDVIRRLVPATTEVLRARRPARRRGRAGPVARCRGALRAPGLAARTRRDLARDPAGRREAGDDSARRRSPRSNAASPTAGVAVFPTDTLYGIGCVPGRRRRSARGSTS